MRKNSDPDKKSELTHKAKDTGMALAFLCLIIAMAWDLRYMYGAAMAVLLVTMVKPGAMVPASKIWFGLADILNMVVPKVILTLVFYLVVTPVGLMRRAMKKDSMKSGLFKKSLESAFTAQEKTYQPTDLKRPY